MKTRILLLSLMVYATLPASVPVFATDVIHMLSGGVGADSAAQVKAREKEFNLKLVITLVEGDFVSDARVRISAGGKVLATHVTDGPFFLARLPAGGYSIAVDYAGQSQTRKVDVRADRMTTDYVRFKRNASDAPTPRE